jgi:S1-C subfamily serine protease
MVSMSTGIETTGSVLAGLSDDLANAVERAGKATVAVRARRNVAAGGIIWSQGVIVTADHVIEHEDDITVILADGREVKGTLAGRDSGTDLAVLRVDATDLPTAEIGESAALRVGHLVLAVARPGGAGLAASIGIVSAVGGGFRTWRGGQIDAMIRADLTMYPGFSGGPLVDAAGRVVGLNTSGLSRGLPLAIPTATIKRVADALLAGGRISRGYLGVGLQPVKLPADLAGKLSLAQQGGLMVVSVEDNGPAAAGGVLLGDILVLLGEKPVDDTSDVQLFLDPGSVGTQTAARVIRAGELRTLTLTVGERK